MNYGACMTPHTKAEREDSAEGGLESTFRVCIATSIDTARFFKP